MDVEKNIQNNSRFFAIQNEKNLQITFSSHGASIYSIKYKNNYVTYHPLSSDEFLRSSKYYGKTLGRICGRIKDGEIVVDGKRYDLDKNEKGNTLHGGVNNLSFVDFNYEINEDDEHINVVFKYLSHDGECGFPANVEFIIVYSLLKKQDKFSIHYVAKPEKTTPINMSTHIYWRLTSKDILDHILKINANEVTLVNQKDLVTIGKTKVNKLFDFTNGKEIGKDILEVAKEQKSANGYDHGFIFNKDEKPLITLKSKKIILTIKTDMNMANIYTNNFPTGGPLKQYGNDIIYGGIAIEPQMYFTSYKDLLVKGGDKFDHYISFELGGK